MTKIIGRIFKTEKHKKSEEINVICKNLTLDKLILMIPDGSYDLKQNYFLKITRSGNDTISEILSKDESPKMKHLQPMSIRVDSNGIKTASLYKGRMNPVFRKSTHTDPFNLDNRHDYRKVKLTMKETIVKNVDKLIKPEQFDKLIQETKEAV